MPGPNASHQKKLRQKNTRRFFLFSLAVSSAAAILAMQWKNLPSRSVNESSGATPPDEPDSKNPNQDPSEASSAETSDAEAAITLLTDPFLQLPTDSSVQVVWFTEFPGTQHTVEYGDAESGPLLTAKATTTQLSRTREDSDSRVKGQAFPKVTRREIWRHEATVTQLKPGFHLPYRVISQTKDGQAIASKRFTLAPTPPKDRPLKILLTSDHQLKPMTPANLQKVSETVGRVDAVFFAGDLVNVPDRASEWFDDASGLALFPSLQGRAQYAVANDPANSIIDPPPAPTVYTGGELIQHAPLFPIIGNHEVMGRYTTTSKLKEQFKNTLPRDQVSRFYPEPNNSNPSEEWIADHSFNTQTYEEIFSLPTTQLPDGSTTQQYYATSFGDVRLVSLYVTQIWRSPELASNTKGRYRESQADLATPETWGYGQHIFEPIKAGSSQYNWLQQELASDEFKNAKYKIVMLHHPPHTLGGNIVPAFTDPVAVETKNTDGTLKSVQYEYPKDEDYLIRDLVPLLDAANVQLVFYGHSHLWNRFVGPGGTHFLETSNVGNSYGAHLADNPRGVPTDEGAIAAGLIPFKETYTAIGDPNGLQPVIPTLSPLTDDSGNPQPYIASNDITSFSIFNTASGTVTSYYFDLRNPNSDVVKFDEFSLTK